MSLPTCSRLNAISSRRRVQESVFLRDLVAVLAQRREVVENPERAPVRGNHQIVILDHQIVHRRRRQVQLQRTPVRTIVERNKHSGFSSCIEEPALLRIFPDYSHKASIRNSLTQFRPAFSVIAGLKDVRPQIVELVSIHSHVGRTGIEGRRIDLADSSPLRHFFRSDVGPRLTFILRKLNQTIVSADPEHPLFRGRFCECEDGVVILRAGVVERDISA